MTSWYGRPTVIGQMRRLRRAVLILIEITRREIVAHPWLLGAMFVSVVVVTAIVDEWML